MAESRDANDPRDAMRGLRKEERAEFDAEEGADTGGQEHATRAEREGGGAERRPREAAPSEVDRATHEQSDADASRTPRAPMPPGEPDER